MRTMFCFGLVAASCLAAGALFADDKEEKKVKGDVPAILNFKMKSLDGEEVDLSKYKGKVLLIVNTASQCGYTPQYKGLEALHEKYADKGLVVLGFPCNQFGGQEPGTETEIGEFCKKNYGVKFDMFSKVDVNGPQQCDLYKFLTSEKTDPEHAGPIAWNFEKFVVSRDGQIVQRYKSAMKPDSPQLVKRIESELAKN